MIDPVETGKNAVASLIGEEARKAGIELSPGDSRWWSDASGTYWRVEVKSVAGKVADQKFSPKQLIGFETDNRLRMQVAAKVTSVVLQLTD